MQNVTSKRLTAVSLAVALAAFGVQAAQAQDTTQETAASEAAASSATLSESAPATATAPESAAPEPAVPEPAAPEPAAAPTIAQLNPVSPPPAGKGQVVFFRPSRLVGAAVSFSVRQGGKGVCKLTNGSYCVYITDPGTTEFIISFEAADTLRLEIEEGETYYVMQSIGMGMVAARPNMAPSSEAAFQEKKLKVSKAKPTDAGQ